VEVFLNILDDQGLPIETAGAFGNPSPGYGPDDYQFLFGVNRGQIHGSGNPLVGGQDYPPSSFPFGVKKTAGGYQMEVVIPWSELRLRPVPGDTLGFDITIDGYDRTDGNSHRQCAWKGTGNNYKMTTGGGRIRLAPSPKP